MGEGGFPALDRRPEVPQPGIAALLASLREQGGECFDGTGWHYLATLAQRAAEQEGSVRQLLEAKLERALGAFAERFALGRSAAAEILATTCEQYPQAAVELERLFAAGDFKALRKLRATLDAREQCAALLELVTHLEPDLDGAAGQAPARHAVSRPSAANSPALELKTVRESRATWARMSVDRQLSLAMKQAPQNAGPINSHMLVLQSLAMMQEISPDYLSHVVSYLDTLLSLDPGEIEVPVKRKKAPAAKSAKTTKTTKK